MSPRVFEREGCVEELRRAVQGPNGVWALGVLSEVAEEQVGKDVYREAYLAAVALSVEYKQIDDGDFPARRAINILEDAADLFEERMEGGGGGGGGGEDVEEAV